MLLKGYARRHAKNRTYPGLLKDDNSQVLGILYRNVIAKDVEILHNFEGYEYIPIDVEVETKQG